MYTVPSTGNQVILVSKFLNNIWVLVKVQVMPGTSILPPIEVSIIITISTLCAWHNIVVQHNVYCRENRGFACIPNYMYMHSGVKCRSVCRIYNWLSSVQKLPELNFYAGGGKNGCCRNCSQQLLIAVHNEHN